MAVKKKTGRKRKAGKQAAKGGVIIHGRRSAKSGVIIIHGKKGKRLPNATVSRKKAAKPKD